MRLRKWMMAGIALLALMSSNAMAQGNGHGNGHNKHDDNDDQDSGHHYYGKHEQDEMRSWYHEQDGHLPPGLAKRDQLPPGLEKQLVVRGTLPPGLRKKMVPCPAELERQLPPPPPDCAHVIIGGHVALINRRTYMVLDVFHFEM
jgi:hypothetical protein